MVEIIGVRFNKAGKIYYFDPCGEQISLGSMVIVETVRGVEIGRVSIPNRMIPDDEIESPLKPIVRVASKEDMEAFNQNVADAKEAFLVAKKMVREHGIEMTLIDCEYTLDKNKLLFYFTADGRVDFRELVKSLATVFKTRIELRQIGVRDEARILGSIGMCGRPLCCSTFLDNFRPVSVKMAKEQGLALNPIKISGTCGRLMCCLQYEYSTYEEALKTMPARGAEVETIDGEGKVIGREILKQKIRVKLNNDDNDGYKISSYNVGEFNIVGEEPTVSLDELKAKKEKEEREKTEALLAQRRAEEERMREFEREAEKEENSAERQHKHKRNGGKSKRRSNKRPAQAARQNSGSDSQNKANPKSEKKNNNSDGVKKKLNGGYTQQ